MTSAAMRTPFPVACLVRAICLALLAAACGGRGPDDAARDAAAAGVAPIVERAEAASRSGDSDAAIEGYSAAIERTPWNTRLRSQLVAEYAKRAEAKRRKPGGAKGLSLAEKDLRAAHELAPEDASVTRSLASVLVERAAFETDDSLAETLRAEATQLSPEVAAQTPVVRL